MAESDEPAYDSDEAIDALLAEFDGDAREAIRALLHDVDALARDYAASVSRGFVRRETQLHVRRFMVVK